MNDEIKEKLYDEKETDFSLHEIRSIIKVYSPLVASNRIWKKIAAYIEETENRIIDAEFALQDYKNKHQWQPIDTAPKDGSIIVAYNAGSHSDNKYETVMWSDGAWRPRKDTCITYPYLKYWQPLPEPPKE